VFIAWVTDMGRYTAYWDASPAAPPAKLEQDLNSRTSRQCSGGDGNGRLACSSGRSGRIGSIPAEVGNLGAGVADAYLAAGGHPIGTRGPIGKNHHVEVRLATASDVDAIAEVHVRSWQETYVGQVPQAYLDTLSIEQRREAWTTIHADTRWPSTGIFVLGADRVVVGFAHVCPSRDTDAPQNIGEVTSIYIRRSYWGRGGGRALMTAALSTLADAGFTAATLWVLSSNERARRFYETNGWLLDGSDKDHTIGGRHVTELRYRRSLTSPSKSVVNEPAPTSAGDSC